MKFYSKKGSVIAILIIFLLVMGGVSLLGNAYIVIPLLALVIAYLLWMWFDTYYTITGDKLFYRCALLRGSVNINTITEVVKNERLLSGVKPALSLNGLIIKYNQWDEIYVSPKGDDEFIDALRRVNQNIIVTG
jgi:amino acid transporter